MPFDAFGIANTLGVWRHNQGNMELTLAQDGLLILADNQPRIYVDPRGNVGIGTQAPETAVEIHGGESDSTLRLARVNSSEAFSLWRYNGGNVEFGALGHDGLMILTDDQPRIYVDPRGNVGIGTSWSSLPPEGQEGPSTKAASSPGAKLEVNGAIMHKGLVEGSSRALKENITDLSCPEALAILEGLNPVKFHWKEGASQTPRLGFIAEEAPDLIASQDKKGIASNHIVAVLTRVVKEQQRMIADLTERINQLREPDVDGTGA